MAGIKEKALSATGSVSGLSGIFSSYTACHNLCITAISLLSVIGITIAGMPLLFLQKIATPLWTAGLVLFGITAYLFYRHKSQNKGTIIANFGLLLAGTPFVQETDYKIYFWTAGAIIIIAAAIIAVLKK